MRQRLPFLGQKFVPLFGGGEGGCTPAGSRTSIKGLDDVSPEFDLGQRYKTLCQEFTNFRNELVFVPGKPSQPEPLQIFHSTAGSWPYPQTLV